MTAEIIQSQISSKQMSTEGNAEAALNDTFQTLKSLQDSESTGIEVEPESNPAIDPKKSIQRIKSFVWVWAGIQNALPQTP